MYNTALAAATAPRESDDNHAQESGGSELMAATTNETDRLAVGERVIDREQADQRSPAVVVGLHEGRHNDVLTYVPGVHETDTELNGGGR